MRFVQRSRFWRLLDAWSDRERVEPYARRRVSPCVCEVFDARVAGDGLCKQQAELGFD